MLREGEKGFKVEEDALFKFKALAEERKGEGVKGERKGEKARKIENDCRVKM